MSHNEKRLEKPEIISATDLVHLNPSQRLPLIGRSEWVNRRGFLLQALRGAAVIVLPASFLTACDDKPTKPCATENACNCESDGSCACESDSGCACESDGGCACESHLAQDCCQVLWTSPTDNDTDVSPWIVVQIAFNRRMNAASFEEGGVAIFPEEAQYNWELEEEPEGSILHIHADWQWEYDTSYTIFVSGVVDVDGNKLDGDNDGDCSGQINSFRLQFRTGGNPCSCESDSSCSCESDNCCGCEADWSCNCQADCPCHSCNCFYYGCMCEVQCGCQLYRV